MRAGIRDARARIRVGVMKPVDTLESQDAQALALAVGSILPMELIARIA